MAFAPGPRNKASEIAGNPLTAEAAWAPNTAYAAGQPFSNGGSTWSSPVAFTSGATFSATGLTLVAGVGAAGTAGTAGAAGTPGASAPLYTGTITCDGTNTVYTVTHNLNTQSVVGQLHNPADSMAVVPGVDITFPTVNTAQVILGAAPASGVQLILIVH